MKLDLKDPKWRFEERVQRLIDKKNLTREEAEQVVKETIIEKEMRLAFEST